MKMLLGNHQLLIIGVSRQLQDLHAVPEGRRDGLEHIGRGDEHDL